MHRESNTIPLPAFPLQVSCSHAIQYLESPLPYTVSMASLVIYLDDGSSTAYLLDSEQPSNLGRHPDNSLVLASDSASSHHATLTPREDGWYVQDLGSSNGTRVNGAPIEEALLEDGDRIGFGDVQAIFYLDDAAAAATAAADAEEPIHISIPVPDVPRSKPTENYIPPPPPVKKKLPAQRLREAKKSYPGEETSGCMSALGVTALCLFAVILGLFLRHQSETGRNFISDAVSSVFGSLPRITIQKTVDETKE